MKINDETIHAMLCMPFQLDQNCFTLSNKCSVRCCMYIVRLEGKEFHFRVESIRLCALQLVSKKYETSLAIVTLQRFRPIPDGMDKTVRRGCDKRKRDATF